MGFILDTLGYAAQRGADIAEQNRIADRKQKESLQLLDYKFDQDKELFDIRETRAEKQLANKAKRDQDKELNDKIKEASLYFKPDKMSVITSGGILGLNLAIEQAKNYVANGYDPNTMMDISDLNVDPKDLNLNTFSSRFKTIPKTDSKTASTYEGEYIRLYNLSLKEQDPKKKEQYTNQANNILALTMDPKSDGQFLSSKQPITTLLTSTIDSVFDNYNQVIRNDMGAIVARKREGNNANVAFLFEKAAELLTKKHDRDSTMPNQQGWINRTNTQFWSGVSSLREDAKQIRQQHINEVFEEFKGSFKVDPELALRNSKAGLSSFRLPSDAVFEFKDGKAVQTTDYYPNKDAVFEDIRKFKVNDVVPFYHQSLDGSKEVQYYIFSDFGSPKLVKTK